MKLTLGLPAEFLSLCRDCSCTPEQVLSGFVADLCALEASNGSDERLLAQQYFARVGYGWSLDSDDSHQGNVPVWRPDPASRSARREHVIIGAYELIAFDLPADATVAREIGWEVYGGPGRQTQLATGTSGTFDEAKAAAWSAWHILKTGDEESNG